MTTEFRKSGGTDPLLLVVGGRDLLPGMREHTQDERRTTVLSNQDVDRYVREHHERWQARLVEDRRFLRLKDLFLPHWLPDFGEDDSLSYLARFGEREQTRVFTDNKALAQMIERVTHGHPLYLALAAETVLEAHARGRELRPDEFEQAEVLQPEHEGEQIGDYLLALFLRQLSEAEQRELVFCAVPRFLDAAVLRHILQLPNDLAARERWQRYHRFTFMRIIDAERMVFHPLVRRLLLLRLHPDPEPKSDYSRVHQGLRAYFERYAAQGDESARVEVSYHALALGDAAPAVALGVTAQQTNLTTWESLLAMLAQAPVGPMPSDIDQQAYDALLRTEQHHDLKDVVRAIILYEWLVVAFQDEPRKVARLQNDLGVAYSNLPGGDRQANLERAIACYEAALAVRTREAFPVEWAMTQNNLGNAYIDLPGGNRQASLERAIACFEAALAVLTFETFPADWAMTQNSLGIAYRKLPDGNHEENLERAIACYEAALMVLTRETSPVDWAMTQNNLGVAYRNLPDGNREESLKRAIACFEAALAVFKLAHMVYDMLVTARNLREAEEYLEGLEQD